MYTRFTQYICLSETDGKLTVDINDVDTAASMRITDQ
jgi:hypothetical protein